MPRNCTVRRSFTGHRVGESHPRAELPREDVLLIRALREEKLGYGTIAKKFELPRSTVQDICNGRRRLYD